MRPVRRGASAVAGAAVARRNTPLHSAARYGHADVAAALINAGADMTIKNIHGCAFAAGAAGPASAAASAAISRRNTPLHRAAYYVNAAATAATLINAGADVTIKNAKGCAFCGSAAGWVSADATAAVARRETPLHLAAESRNADVAAALIGAGADVTVKNIDGYAALRCAAWPTATAAARLPAGGRQSNTGSHLRRQFLNFMGTFLEVLDQSLKPYMWIGPQNHYQYRQFKKHDVMKGSPHTRRP